MWVDVRKVYCPQTGTGSVDSFSLSYIQDMHCLCYATNSVFDTKWRTVFGQTYYVVVRTPGSGEENV